MFIQALMSGPFFSKLYRRFLVSFAEKVKAKGDGEEGEAKKFS